MWGEWLRANYRPLLLCLILLIFLGLHVARRVLRIEDAAQLEFLNDCTKITLGAVIGVLSERLSK